MMSNTSIDRLSPSDDMIVSDNPAPTLSLSAFRSLGEITLELSAELGRVLISVRELLRLSAGDVLVLARPTGENIDLFVGDVLIGKAEIAATNEKMAIRLADLFDKPGSALGQSSAVGRTAAMLTHEKGQLS